jgi:hypothetical protein
MKVRGQIEGQERFRLQRLRLIHREMAGTLPGMW